MKRGIVHLLIIGFFFAAGCGSFFREKFPNNADLKYEKHYFLDKKIMCDLPENLHPRNHSDLAYIVLFSKWLGGSAGNGSISEISVLNWKKNNNAGILLLENKKTQDDGFKTITRRAYYSISEEIGIKLYLSTSVYEKDLPNPEFSKRFSIDDQIFSRIVESIRILNDKGEYIKPPVKEVETEKK
jgi:hypothetical protein